MLNLLPIEISAKMDYQDEEELINPEEIKQEEEFMHCDETSPTDLSELLRDLKFLKDTVLKSEIKLGEIVDKWQHYFGDHISCNFNLMLDWLLSIKSSLDEVTQKYRADLSMTTVVPTAYVKKLMHAFILEPWLPAETEILFLFPGLQCPPNGHKPSVENTGFL
ncbi:uncharacterized protein LOC118433223 [Folsomia candida]|uniref:uncharacterized protein LOC118433223 n=1 Tax=Folsomia candida TaxID=158441 RepID=UPI0016053162|nr:uncharacterized protein LOC118433223 [Folsomia candida]